MTAFETTMPVRLAPDSRTLEREVDLPPAGQTITFGAHGDVARHYGMPEGAPEGPTTLDYLVASVGGCLIGTFAGSLRRAKVPVGRTGLTATATAASPPTMTVSCGSGASPSTTSWRSPPSSTPRPRRCTPSTRRGARTPAAWRRRSTWSPGCGSPPATGRRRAPGDRVRAGSAVAGPPPAVAGGAAGPPQPPHADGGGPGAMGYAVAWL